MAKMYNFQGRFLLALFSNTVQRGGNMSVAEREKIFELLKAIHDLTGIKAAVYDLDYHELMAYPAESIALCNMIHSREAGLAACSQSEQKRCEACKQSRSRQLVLCHAGLTEIVVPIMNGDAVIGYIMLGQFVDSDRRDVFLQQVAGKCAELGLNSEELMKCAARVPCCSQAQMQSVSKLVDVIASYLVFSGILYPSETPLRQTILDHIGKNLSSDLSVQALCRRFSVSKSELYRLLRQQAPEGVAAYVREKRFQKACELLRYTRKAIWQIAEEVGYDNPDYFLRAFKKEVGVSAGKYRKNLE